MAAAGVIPPLPDGWRDVANVLDRARLAHPDAEALAGRYSRYTYSQLLEQVNAACAALQSIGVQPGDRVGASAPNHPEIVIAFLAVQRLGAVWVGINRPLAPPEKAYILKDAGIKVVLASADVIEQFRAIDRPGGAPRVVDMEAGRADSEWAELLRRHAPAQAPSIAIDPLAPAAISYTSGTTGEPKGVVHSQRNLLLPAVMARVEGVWEGGERRGIALPLTINNNMVLGPIVSLVLGTVIVCMDRLDVQGIIDWVRREKIGMFAAVPTLIFDLMNDQAIDSQALASLVRIKTGGTALPESFRARFLERFGCELQNTYGLTEAPTIVTETRAGENYPPGSSGRALPHLDVAILDDNQDRLPPGEVGEVCVRAVVTGQWANVYRPMLGYWNRPDATAQTLRNGWLHTGDMGYIEDSGDLFIKDRKKDLIIRGGSNIYPVEIERVVYEDKRVQACAVMGMPDARLGEVVVAFVQPAAGVVAGVDTETLVNDLKARCAAALARYKHPSEWVLVKDMPRNSLGKIVKPDLRKKYLGSASLTPHADSR